MSSIKNISLFIPHVYANYTREKVMEVFDAMLIGKVKNVDFVQKMGSDGKPYNAAYIHFHEWYDNIAAHNFQSRVLNPDKEARVMYDDPWYWIVLENKGKKRVPGERKPRLELDTLNESIINPKPSSQVNLQNVFNAKSKSVVEEVTQKEIDLAFEQMENEQMMAEIEHEMEMDDRHLATFDTRYVKSLEEENAILRGELAHVQNLYNAVLIQKLALEGVNVH